MRGNGKGGEGWGVGGGGSRCGLRGVRVYLGSLQATVHLMYRAAPDKNKF